MTARFAEHKRRILDRLLQTADLAEKIGSKSLADDIRHVRASKIEAERFHVVVLGEFNHGKSTFVNAVLDKNILPVGITPTTAAINHIVYAQEERAEVKFRDGSTKDIDVSELGSWVTTEAKEPEDIAYVEIGVESDLLKDNVTLVDTPGVNDLNEQRAEITYGYVPRADAVIFLLDASQALKESEREFLSSHILESAKERLLFIVGKVDVLGESERKEVMDYVRRSLQELIGAERPIFEISAKQWVDSQDPSSGVPKVKEFLTDFLRKDRMQVLLENAVVDSLRAASYVEHNLNVKRYALDLEVGDLEERVKKVEEQLAASQKDLAELQARIKSEAQSMKTQIEIELQSFTRDFCEALPAQIDSVHSADLQTYLPRYLEDKFREWAYSEGEKLGMQMQSLAEDVIAVTNQNLAATSEVVSEQLTPQDTQINIDIDSLKYDVGIYAIGALGTTVFLFVNTLAGGLLTLAAPILSIIVKSKVEGDIRAQAKERAPVAVKRAAEAVKPHFDQCIEDFAERLSSFVSTAGNSLYAGITELLHATLKERSQITDSTEKATAPLDALDQEISEIVTGLKEVQRELD